MPPKPVNKKKDKPTINEFDLWKARIDSAKKAREPLCDDGSKYRDYYEGKIKPKGYKNIIAVNLVYVDMKQSVSEYYSKNPKIFVDPDEPGAEADARVCELAINKKWDDLKMKRIVREAIKGTKFDGVCAFKTYFNFKENFVKDEWDDRVQNDEVRTDSIPLSKLLKDQSAPHWRASWWIAHQIDAKKADIAERFDLSEEQKKQITTTAADPDTEDYDDQYGEGVTEDFEYGTFYEIENRKDGTIAYIVDGIDGFVKGPDKKRYKYDTMYDFLMYNEIPGKKDPKSDYSFWEDQLLELATYRSMEVAHARKGNSKYVSTSQTPLDPSAITQLKSDEDAVVVQLKPDQRVDPFQHATLDPQLFQAENACRMDIQTVSKQAVRQIAGGDKTATEVKAVEASAMSQVSENVEILEEVMASIANKWISLMQENYSSSRMVSLTGMSEAEFLANKNLLGDSILGTPDFPNIQFTKKSISKKIKARIEAGSTTPVNDQTRVARLQGFAQFAATAQLQAGIDQQAMLEEAAEAFGVQNENLLIQKDNPVEESRLLNSGVYIAPKMGEDHKYHLEVHKRESNNSEPNLIHIWGHLMFKKQIETMESAKAVTAQAAQNQAPVTGVSFNGMPPIPGMPAAMAGPQGPAGAQMQAAPMPPGGPGAGPIVQ